MNVELLQAVSDGAFILQFKRNVGDVSITVFLPTPGGFTPSDLRNFWKVVKAVEHLECAL